MTTDTKIEIRFDHRNNLKDSEALKAYTKPKLVHACEHGHALKVSLVFSIQDQKFHQVEALIHMPRNVTQKIQERKFDMYTAVDYIVPKIEAVIRKNADQMSNYSHQSACRSQTFGRPTH
tara:strand:- start:3491 stop:3850 length:360 start_codon:yes stop_codon:yes gene_type:complete